MLILDRLKGTGQKYYASAEYWNSQWKQRPATKVSDHAMQAILNLAGMQDKTKECIVEIGGGLNPVLDVIRGVIAPDADYIGYDFSEVAQTVNRVQWPWAKWDVVDVTTGIPLVDEQADFVLSSHLIEHLDDPYQLIEEQLRICKRGGGIAIVAPVHLYHREHKQVLTLDSLVGMMKDYAMPVLCYPDARNSEAVVGIIKP